VQYNSSKTASSVRSLVWPGYFFYHDIGTSSYGSIYIGYGENNSDIGFMMSG
jgi:radial spoke head protein 9